MSIQGKVYVLTPEAEKAYLVEFAEEVLKKFYPDCCPACQLPMNYDDYIRQEELIAFVDDYMKKGKGGIVLPKEEKAKC